VNGRTLNERLEAASIQAVVFFLVVMPVCFIELRYFQPSFPVLGTLAIQSGIGLLSAVIAFSFPAIVKPMKPIFARFIRIGRNS